jgi:ankyrin repeat protein
MNVLHFAFILPQDQTPMANMLLDNLDLVQQDPNQKVLNEQDRKQQYLKQQRLKQQCTVDNWTPLILAVINPHITPELIHRLIKDIHEEETKEERKNRIEDETYQLLIAFEKVAQNLRVRTFAHLNPIVDKCRSKVRYQVLHSICRYDRKDMLDWALNPEMGKLQQYINEKDQAGYTPFLTAVFYGATKCIEKLLEVSLLLTLF